MLQKWNRESETRDTAVVRDTIHRIRFQTWTLLAASLLVGCIVSIAIVRAVNSRLRKLTNELTVEAANRRVGTYSGGMRRRIDIGCGLVVRPEVVFLDEPSTGLDPRSRQGIWDLVTRFKEAGIATEK